MFNARSRFMQPQERPLVWVVYPAQRAVTVHTPGEPPRTLGEEDMLTAVKCFPVLRLRWPRFFGCRLQD